VSAAGTGEAAFTVRQVFTNTGLSAPPSDTFNYILKPKAPSNPMPAGSKANGYEFKISGTGNAQISITFSQTGIYVYELRHITKTQPGYIYDTEIYTIEIIIKNDLTGTVVVYKDDKDKAAEIKFNHSYKLLPSDPKDMLDPPVVKTVANNPGRNDTFIFRLTAGNSANPMPAGSVNGVKDIYIKGSGQASFGTWAYTEEGTYYYTIAEVNTGMRSYIYDDSSYTITDSVKAAGGQLAVSRTVKNKSNRQVTSMSFINTYIGGWIPPITPEPSVPEITDPSTQPPTEPTTPEPSVPGLTDPSTQTPNTSVTFETQPPTLPEPSEPSVPGTTEPSIQPPTEPTVDPPEETATNPDEPIIFPEEIETTPDTSETGIPVPPVLLPGHNLIFDDDGEYIEIDENDVAIGTWIFDDDTGEWIFIEYPLLPKDAGYGFDYYDYDEPEYGTIPKTVPQTGDESQTGLYFVLFCVAGSAGFGSAGYLLYGKLRKERKAVKNES